MNDDLQNREAAVLQSALKQLEACANRQPSAMFYWEAQALLDERDVLRDACTAIVHQGDLYTATRDWPDPAVFAGWAIVQARAALAKTRNE